MKTLHTIPVCLIAAFLLLPGCFKLSQPKIVESVSPRLVMGPMDDTGKTLQKTQQTVLRIGDREYVSSVLTNVFGPSAASTVQDLIHRRPSSFGGPCDNWSDEQMGNPNCNMGDVLASTVPSSTSAREALRTQACNLIIENDAAVAFAAAQVRNTNDGMSVIMNRPGRADVVSAYDLFMPGRPPSDEVVDTLKTSVVDGAIQAGQTNKEAWRFMFLTLCLSPNWQIL